MDFEEIVATLIIILMIGGVIALMYFCVHTDYDYVEKELVQAVVIEKSTHFRRIGKTHRTVYRTKFKYEDIETKIEGSSLYKNLDIGDEITMNKCIYYKDGEITKTKLELIK